MKQNPLSIIFLITMLQHIGVFLIKTVNQEKEIFYLVYISRATAIVVDS